MRRRRRRLRVDSRARPSDRSVDGERTCYSSPPRRPAALRARRSWPASRRLLRHDLGRRASSPPASRCSTPRRSPTSACATRSRFVVALFAFGLRARGRRRAREWGHVTVAGLLSHAGYLGGSHYAQRWGLSAGVTALVLALQPLLTAVIVSRWLHERLGALQKIGVGVGLAGVALVVGQRAEASASLGASLLAVVLGARSASPPARSTSASSAPAPTCARRSASTSSRRPR